MQIKILLSDDQKGMREGLRSTLEKHDEFIVTAEADSTENTLALVGELKPDVVIIDIGQADMDNIDATSQIVAVAPGTKVIVLSMSMERRHVVGMLKSGTSGYVSCLRLWVSTKCLSTTIRAFLLRPDYGDMRMNR